MPFGYLEFSRAIRRDLCSPAHTYMRARRRWRRRRPAGRFGFGFGFGFGFPTGLVLFESGLRVWVASIPLRYLNRTRSAIRIRTAPPTDPLRQRLSRQLDGQRLRCLGRTVATVQTEPLQLFVGFGPVGPSWSVINSAPNSQLKTHQEHQQKERNLSAF